jgi:hypothetical protein
MPRIKQNARFAAQSMMIAEIEHSEKIPVVCKNLMIENVQSHMHALGNALGCIELAARRAAEHGIKTSVETSNG